MVSGRMTVTLDGGEPLELVAGDSAVFPKGWSGTWDIARDPAQALRDLLISG